MQKEGFVEVEGGRVWYQLLGDLSKGATPLVVLHGGPGSSHLRMSSLGSLQTQRPILLYDQLGCGKSDRPLDVGLWKIERFVRELEQIREALNLETVHLLGHSWGTMLLADYLLQQPKGVQSAIFSSPCLSATRWIEDANVYRSLLPETVQKLLLECEAAGTTDTDVYQNASQVYLDRHVCRIQLSDEEVAQGRAAFGKEVYEHMWGPSEFCATGNLKDYEQTQRLHEIQVPALFTCGRFDEASPASTELYHSLMPQSEFHVFECSSHTPQLEQPEEYLKVIQDFLKKVDMNCSVKSVWE